MGGSFSNSNRRRNRYLEQYPPPPPPPPVNLLYSNRITPPNSMLPYLHNHSHNASTSSQRHDIDVNSGQSPPYPQKLMNDVNLHRDTIRMELDPNKPDHHLISFNFDASYDGRITIIYFGKEEENRRVTPVFPQASKPITFPFQKGHGQKFCQPSGTGIDLRFFELDDLSNPSPEQNVFPLVVCAESDASPNMQITQAVLYKSNGDTGTFQVKVVNQILWVDQLRYEMNDIYGTGDKVPSDFDRNDPGMDCVICIIEPRDTVVLPCRHMSMCSECAKALRFQSNKCRICHEPIRDLMQIQR